jgi:hypothetical protein
VIRYVAKVLELPAGEVAGSEAARLIKAAAELGGWDVSCLDHAVWLFESGRLVKREVA